MSPLEKVEIDTIRDKSTIEYQLVTTTVSDILTVFEKLFIANNHLVITDIFHNFAHK